MNEQKWWLDRDGSLSVDGVMFGIIGIASIVFLIALGMILYLVGYLHTPG